MQNRPLETFSVSYSEITLPEDFPVAFTRHLQRYQSGALHFHNGIEIGICYEGTGLFFIGSRILPFGPGDVTVIFPDQPHIAQSPDDRPSKWSFLTVDAERMYCDMTAEQFRPVRSLIDGSHRDFPGLLPGSEHPVISHLTEMIFTELEGQGADYRLSVKSLMLSLLLMVARLPEIGRPDDGKRGAETSGMLLLSPAVSHICSHYGEEITVTELARLCSLSVTHFRRVFRNTMGRSPSDYLLEVRMRMARSLLKSTDCSVSEVAMRTGYRSISSFNRQFRQSYHMSPREYRKQQ